jgi:hypothetical protein
VSQLNARLLLTIATGTASLCLIPASAHALSLTVGGSSVPNLTATGTNNNGSLVFTTSNTQSTTIGSTPVTITPIVNTSNQIQPLLLSQTGLIDASGNSVTGVVLKFTNLNLTAVNTLSPSGTVAAFSNTFTGTLLAPIFRAGSTITVTQILSGSFRNLSGTASVEFPAITLGFNGATPTVPAGLSGLATGNITNGNAFYFNTASNSFTTASAVTSLTVTGQLSNLNMPAGTTLNLPSSACFVISTRTPQKKYHHGGNANQSNAGFSADDANAACGETSVPEPSSAVGLMALGTLGIATWMRRRSTKVTLD